MKLKLNGSNGKTTIKHEINNYGLWPFRSIAMKSHLGLHLRNTRSTKNILHKILVPIYFVGWAARTLPDKYLLTRSKIRFRYFAGTAELVVLRTGTGHFFLSYHYEIYLNRIMHRYSSNVFLILHSQEQHTTNILAAPVIFPRMNK